MSASGSPAGRLAIVDAHVHVFDSRANVHRFLDAPDAMMEALVGDYAALPRRFAIADYLAAVAPCEVQGIVCHEYLSDDPLKEMAWLQRAADEATVPVAIVALVDFLDPGLEARLDAYAELPAITSVRQHLGWDADHPLRRFAARGDLLDDPAWRAGIGRLARRGYVCALEVFAPQLPALLPVVRANPDIGFTIAVLGWPVDLSGEGFLRWRADMAALATCGNVRLQVSGVECIFGMGWSVETLRRWLGTAIELFGPHRVMLGSHMPITTLSRGFAPLYAAYGEVLAGFSDAERDQMFRANAAGWFRLPPPA